jgi:hypothetical protein
LGACYEASDESRDERDWEQQTHFSRLTHLVRSMPVVLRFEPPSIDEAEVCRELKRSHFKRQWG